MKQKYFDLKVGFTCNNDCVHCVITEKKGTKDLTTAEIKTIIDGLSSEYIVGFTGGEATIRPDFLELLKYAKNTGHKTALQTNGTMFANMDFAQQVSIYLDSVLFAIHSHLPHIHNEIVNDKSQRMHSLTMQGFKNLATIGKVAVRTQTVISKINIKDLPETYDYIQEVMPGVPMSLTYPHPNGNAWTNREIVMPKYSEIKPYLHAILKKWGNMIQTEAIPMCYLYPYQDSIDWNIDEKLMVTKVNLEGMDPANKHKGFFDEDGFTDDYQASMLSEKRKGPKCNECPFNERCAGVWKEYLEYYRTDLDLFPPVEVDPQENRIHDGAIIIYSNDCMNNCNFCGGIGDPQKRSAIERWQQFIADAQYFIDRNAYRVEISGGDPGEFEFIAEAVAYLKMNGIEKVQLSTHGRTLADPELVRKLKLAGLDYCKVAMYGSTAEIHEKTTEAVGSFADSLAAIKNCAAFDIKVCGHTILNNFNEWDINNIIRLYLEASKGKMYDMIISVAYITELDPKYWSGWHLPVKCMSEAVKDIIDNHPPLPEDVRFAILDLPYCTYGKYTDVIENKPSSAPDLGTHKVEEVNRSKESDYIPQYRIKAHFEECNKCDLKSICGGITVNEIKISGVDGLVAIGRNVSGTTEAVCDPMKMIEEEVKHYLNTEVLSHLMSIAAKYKG